jgi:peroxiredoxin
VKRVKINSFFPKYFLIIFLIFINITEKHAGSVQDFQNIIQKIGITPLYSDPVDIELPDLNKKPQKLSQYKGKWIWLVFWATWCSVCSSELTTIESLYQEFKNRNLIAIGVSLDSGSPNEISSYLKKRNISFPNLQDINGKAGGIYKANAVPTLYIISPDWKVIGMVRGALNWERKEVLKHIKKLIKYKKVMYTDSQQYQDLSDSELSLPEKLHPPKLNIIKPEGDYHANSWIPLEIEIRWPGSSRDYIIKVPKLTVPEKVKIGKISSIASSRLGNLILRYKFPIMTELPGKYKIGPVDLSYKSRYNITGSDLNTRIPALTIEVIQSYVYTILIVGGILLFLCIIFLIFWFKKIRPQKNKGKKLGEQPIRKFEAEFKKLKKEKISCSRQQYSIRLLEYALEMVTAQPSFKKRIEQDFSQLDIRNKLEKIRYGGDSFLDNELERLEKTIEKEFEELD